MLGKGKLRTKGLLTIVSAALVAVPLTLAGQSMASAAPTTHAAPLGSAATLPSPMLANRGTRAVCNALIAKGHCLAQVVTTSKGSSQTLSSNTPIGLGPADLQKAYALPAFTKGSKDTIGIIDAGSYPTLASDLAVYRKTYGLPACTTSNGCLKVVGETGGAQTPPGTTDDEKYFDEDVALETSLDVDMASAACPTCKILVVQPQRRLTGTEDQFANGFATATNTAVRLGAKAISMSWQFDPSSYLDSGARLRAMYHPGVAITASSGDGGYEGTNSGWPQNLSSVISVGGTSLYNTPNSPRGFTESAWDGAGSGCSSQPAGNGQPSSVSSACSGKRTDSDVSAVADPTTGVAVYDTYSPYFNQPTQWAAVGGTSASSPFIAGLFARSGKTAGVLGPNTIYGAPATAWNDVRLGQNAPENGCTGAGLDVCDAGNGWDGPTGVGTPHGLAGF